MRDERRKEERSKQDQTNNNTKKHSTSKAVTFPKKNELPQVELMYIQYASKKSPVSVPVPFCYGKTGDFFHPVLPVPFRSVPFRSVV